MRVTALGGALPPSRIPYAVGVQIPGATARLRPPLAVDEPLRGIPGVAVDNRYNVALGERITIRGFGARTQFGVRGVHVDVDGVPATMPDGQTTMSHVDAATVTRAEALRGPASSLYGNSAGGAILLRTWPAANANHASGGFALGERGTTIARGELGGTRGAWSGAARAGSLDYRGYRVHSDARDLRAGARLARSAGRDTVTLTVASADYDADNPGGLTDSARTANPRGVSATNLRFQTGERGVHRQSGLAWRHAAERWSFDASGWGLTRRVDNPIPQRIIDLRRKAAGARATIETRALLEGALVLGAGAQHGSQGDDRRGYNSIDGVRGTIAQDQLEHVGADGAFVRAALLPGERVSLLAALRADRVRFDVRDRLVTPTNPDDGGARTMSAVSPSAGIAYAWSPRLAVYANLSTAFETPTTTELANRPSGAGGLNPDLAPQHVASAEVGARLPAFATGAISIAVFDARVRDALVPYELATAPGRQFYRNASRARHRGMEASASTAVGRWGVARAAATLLDAHFAVTDSAAGLRAGKRIPGIAPFRGDLSVAASGSGPIRAELIVTAQSRTPVDDANSAWSPGFAVLDAALGARSWNLGAASVTAGVLVVNVLDRRFDTSVVPNAARGRFFEPGPPRTVTLTLEIGRAIAAR